MSEDIFINRQLTIPHEEIRFTASRASGPGGQHVNTADTRIELRWNIRQSAVLSDSQRERITMALASRINRRGELVLRSGTRRSQHQNRQEVLTRLVTLVQRALAVRKRRVQTKPPASTRERRLQEKKRRAEIKHRRQRPESDE